MRFNTNGPVGLIDGKATGKPSKLNDAQRQALARIGVVFQQPTLDLDLSVRRNLRYFAALHGLAGREADHRIDAALDRMGMAQRADEIADRLEPGSHAVFQAADVVGRPRRRLAECA